jgi:6-phosphogluconate dehydrogenase
VVKSWLLDLAELALRPGAGFEDIEPYVVDSGEGRWTIEAALERDVPVPVIAASLFRRFESREKDSYGLRLLAALRNQFGGHAVVRAGEKPPS